MTLVALQGTIHYSNRMGLTRLRSNYSDPHRYKAFYQRRIFLTVQISILLPAVRVVFGQCHEVIPPAHPTVPFYTSRLLQLLASISEQIIPALSLARGP